MSAINAIRINTEVLKDLTHAEKDYSIRKYPLAIDRIPLRTCNSGDSAS